MDAHRKELIRRALTLEATQNAEVKREIERVWREARLRGLEEHELKQLDENPELFAPHDSFLDHYKEYERIRLLLAREMRSPERERDITERMSVIYRETAATSFEDFTNEVMSQLAADKLAVTRAEVELYVMTFLWDALAVARNEIAKFPERMRKRRNGRD